MPELPALTESSTARVSTVPLSSIAVTQLKDNWDRIEHKMPEGATIESLFTNVHKLPVPDVFALRSACLAQDANGVDDPHHTHAWHSEMKPAPPALTTPAVAAIVSAKANANTV